MRILFITASYLPTSNGVTYHISSTANALRKLGHKVYILAPSFPGYKDKDKYVIRYPSLPNPFVKNYPLGIPLVPINKIKKMKIDIVHTHHPLIIGEFAGQISKKVNKPLFFTAHTQYEQYLNYYFPQGYDLTSKIIINDLKKLASNCNKVICPSENTQKRLLRYKINNTSVVSNGVEDLFINKPGKKNTSIPTIAYTGRLDKEKNLFFLINVAVKLKPLIPNFKLLIIGSGLIAGKLSDQIIKNGLEQNVFLLGESGRDTFPEIYKYVHLFITPSKSEVMPLSLIEAMTSGIPAIVLEKSGLEEIVIDGISGYKLKENSTIIAQKIKEIFSKPKLLNKLSLSTYNYSKKYSSKKTALNLIEMYKKELNRKDPFN